jgi:hypothetical protein
MFKTLEITQIQYHTLKPVIRMSKSKSYSMKRIITGMFLLVISISILSFTFGKSIANSTHFKEIFSHTKIVSSNFNRTSENALYNKLSLSEKGLSESVFMLAYHGFEKLNSIGKLNTDSILTIIDYSKSSREKRMFVVDLKSQTILFHTVVAHGRNSGQEFAKEFSNNMNSHQTSLGFYITGSTYAGSNGYSLQLKGIEAGINDKALARAIVIHGAAYANESTIYARGYLGRSYGCPALPQKMSAKIIDKIKGGSLLFAYYPDNKYLKKSEIING